MDNKYSTHRWIGNDVVYGALLVTIRVTVLLGRGCWKTTRGTSLRAENFHFGNFRHLLNDTANIELILI